MGVVSFVVAIGFGILQMALGYAGLDYLLGTWAAIIGLALALVFRFMLPVTVGTYFGVVEVVGWPWWAGILIAAPGLLFMVPAFIASALEGMQRR